jgi:hypothetical protein
MRQPAFAAALPKTQTSQQSAWLHTCGAVKGMWPPFDQDQSIHV